MIIVKTIGIFLIKDIIDAIPQFVATLFFLFQNSQGEVSVISAITALVAFGLYASIPFILLFRTGAVIKLLKLDNGFDQEKLTLDISLHSMLNLGVIVAGAVILTTEVPNLCRYIIAYIQERNLPFQKELPDYSRIIISGVKVLIALLFIGERKRIVAFIEARNTAKVHVVDEQP